MTTAVSTDARIQGSFIHTGVKPRNTFLRVPPEIDAIVAINAIPP
jgi:hypothetical protein